MALEALLRDFQLIRLGKSSLTIRGNDPTQVEVPKAGMMPDDAFTNVDFWPMPNGDWVITQYNFVQLGAKKLPVGEAERIRKPDIDPSDEFGINGGVRDAEEAKDRMVLATMRFLKFSWAGKLLAERMKWSITDEWS